jgi:hypothetical protein
MIYKSDGYARLDDNADASADQSRHQLRLVEAYLTS